MTIPGSSEMSTAEELWDYLVIGQEPLPAECILVFGGHDLGVAGRAVELYREGMAPLVLVSGGSANVPPGGGFATEADAILDVLFAHGVDPSGVLVERLASNTSENFWFSAELLRDRRLSFERFLVVQKPYCERRTLATARRRWPDKFVQVTSQQVTFKEYCSGDIPVARILSMLAGEILRLDAYGRSGLIEVGEEVPPHLLEGARRLQDSGFSSRALGRA